jgi:hypothetical protein
MKYLVKYNDVTVNNSLAVTKVSLTKCLTDSKKKDTVIPFVPEIPSYDGLANWTIGQAMGYRNSLPKGIILKLN